MWAFSVRPHDLDRPCWFQLLFSGSVFPLPLPSCALSLTSSRQPEVSWVSQHSELPISSPCICSGCRWPETPPSSCCLGTLCCTGLSSLSRSRGISLGLSTEGFGLSETGLGTEHIACWKEHGPSPDMDCFTALPTLWLPLIYRSLSLFSREMNIMSCCASLSVWLRGQNETIDM